MEKIVTFDVKAWKKALKPATIEDKLNIQFGHAVKKDKGKVRMDLLPPKALIAIAKIMTYGATKYSDFNYKKGKGLEWRQLYAACLRHLNAWNDGVEEDEETGESPLYHAGCCIMMLIDLIDSKKGKDTRFKGRL